MSNDVRQNEEFQEKREDARRRWRKVMLLTKKGSIKVSVMALSSEVHPTIIPQPQNPSQQSTRGGSLSTKQNTSSLSTGKGHRPRSCKCRKKKKRHELDFEKKGIIGNGGFGKVFLVSKRDSQKENKDKYAMKVICKEKLQQTASIQNLIIEKTILTEVQSQFIVGLKFSFQDRKKCFMVMEYADGGDLYSYLHNKQQPQKVDKFKSLKQEGPRFILACVCRAIETLHSKKIAYRDLKPENILIFSDGYVKLSDFGLAAYYPENDYLTEVAGTRIYMAPEMVEDRKYSKEVDLWAMGILLYEMILYETPYTAVQIAPKFYRKKCNADQRERKWKAGDISQEAKDLINELLRVKPEERIGAKSFDDIKNHPFFKGFNWQALENKKIESPLLGMVGRSKIQEHTRDSVSENHNETETHQEQYEDIPELNYGQIGQSPERRLTKRESCECHNQIHQHHHDT